MRYKSQFLIHQFSNSLILSAFGCVNLDNLYLSNQFNLRNLRLKIRLPRRSAAKTGENPCQSVVTNYAKQTQF